MQIINQRTELVPIDTMRPHERNVNQGNLGAIHESIEHTGFYGTIVVQESSGRVLAGNHRLVAMQQAGATEIPVTYVDVDDETALRILLVDNRSTREGVDDSNALATLLQELAATPSGLAGSGYDGDALDELLADLGQGQPALVGDPDAVPEVPGDQEPRTKRGDIIRLGRHTLGCIDSTNVDEVRRLLDGVTPDLLLADPPYGIDLETDTTSRVPTQPLPGRERALHCHARIVGDDRDFNRSHVPLVAPEEFWFGADYYVDTLPTCGKDGAWFVWDKRQEGALDEMRGNNFELCWSKQRHKRQLWRVTWVGVLGHVQAMDGPVKAHAAQKPVALLRAIIEQFSAPGAVVVDPFAGSGSTLVSCEVAERACYAAEIEPAYCDVIVQRWEDLTGQTAVREQIADDARVLTG